MSKRETYTHRPMQISDDTLTANWSAINWNSRDGVQNVHGDAPQDGLQDGAGAVQAPDAPVPTGPSA